MFLVEVERVGVAAKHDIGTAARHVSRDGNGAGPPRLRDDGGLSLVLLGVEDLVGTFFFLSMSLMSSDLEMSVVPTSTGWPRL